MRCSTHVWLGSHDAVGCTRLSQQTLVTWQLTCGAIVSARLQWCHASLLSWNLDMLHAWYLFLAVMLLFFLGPGIHPITCGLGGFQGSNSQRNIWY